MLVPTQVDNKGKWLALAPFVKRHFKTDMNVKDIAFELSYADYLQQKKKDDLWRRFSEEIG